MIIVACDKFKGSLSAQEVALICSTAAHEASNETVQSLVVADGGDGTVDAFIDAGFDAHCLQVKGPIGNVHDSHVAMKGGLAIVELADTCGIVLLPDGALEPLQASTYGLGQAIAYALDQGATTVIIGLGGSASNDGGIGMLAGLGMRFFDEAGHELPPNGQSLGQIKTVDTTQLHPRIGQAKIICAVDVDNPLLGRRGAISVFGPQKGAVGHVATTLESGMENWVTVSGRPDLAMQPGAGAGGGTAFGAIAFLGAKLRTGVDIVLDALDFDKAIAGASLVITGEGTLDEQTLSGKTVAGVARRAREAGVPVIAVCGHCDLDRDDPRLAELGVSAVHALTDINPDPDYCMAHAAEVLSELIPHALGTSQ